MVYKSRQIFLPFCHNLRVWRADRQTDRILIARPRLHYMQRGQSCNTQLPSQHSNSYATVLSLSDNASISWYTIPEGRDL